VKVPLFWVLIIAGLSVCTGGIVDDLLEADCPDAVVETVCLDSAYSAGVFNGRCMVLEYWSQCVQGLDPDDSLIFSPPHSYYENCADSIAVLNERLEKQQATLNHWDTAGSPSFRHLEGELCSGMVSIAAVEGCVDPVTNTWGGSSLDPDYEEWSVTDTLYFVFDYNRWDSLKQARGL
jgi:hypothetical protein